MTREKMKDKKEFVKITYNNVRIIWILIYLVYMFFYGFTSYEAINQKLNDRTTYLVNLFNTLYNQNAIQMISNPENFKRVLVSDIEGEVLLQYGELIPALTNLEYNVLFSQLQTDKIALSEFYYDPVIDEICFDMGIIEKNRVYIGTLSAEKFLRDNLENLEMDHFLIFDPHFNGYIYKNGNIASVNYFNKDQISWINESLFLSDKTLYLCHWDKLNNYQYITYIPFMKTVFPLFIYSVIPFILGLLTIFWIENMEKRKSERNRYEMERQLSLIIKNNKVPNMLQKSHDDFNSDLFRKLNDKFVNAEKQRKDMKRYVERLSFNSEQLLEVKNDLEYLEKFFCNLMDQDEFDFSEAIKMLFRIVFEKTGSFSSLKLRVNNQTIFNQERENDITQTAGPDESAFNSLELGRHTIKYYLDLDPIKTGEFSNIRMRLFEILSRYIALIYSVKRGLNPAELSLTKNFSIFSEMVNREIEKVKRYHEKGMLFYLDILNYSRIKEKYGISVAKILLKRISEIIISKVRTSDIVGIYREGTFLVYFCNLDISDAKIKIEKICNNIYNDEKIKQIGINIELKNSIVSVEKDIQDFDDLLLKCLKSDKK